MVRSKSSLKVQNQLTDTTVKCNRMLIKSCDQLASDVELFYEADYSTTLQNALNNNLPAITTPAFVNSTANTKHQFRQQLMNSIQKRLNIKSNNNLDKLKLELEYNLRPDNHVNCSTGANSSTNNTTHRVLMANSKENNDQTKEVSNQANSNAFNGLMSHQGNCYSNNYNNANSVKSLNCETVPNNGATTQPTSKPASRKLFIRNNSTATPSLIDDNWLLLNSKSTIQNGERFQSSVELHSDHRSLDAGNAQLTNSTNSTINAINCLNESTTTTILSGHLNQLCTKNYWLFTCVNWKRRFCVLDVQDRKLIVKDNQVGLESEF